ncbi:hypothetical protein WA026_002225 [Henosepilachna vigintioctopunctata]|uniref:Uncharacterized protein n=1 Tax=Henosepilachna vigintioctopunctata TaxID=420089 RepID=A0AAW1U3B9_9CUCU
MWILIVALSIYVLPNVCARSLRRDPDLFTFNTAINSNITAKIQDEAVIVSLIKTAHINEDLTKEHILFGFDIFHFVPQNFRVSVNYPNKKILLNITSTINTYSIPIGMKRKEKIKSLFLRMNDEDDTVFAVVNCDGSTSVVTPINLIKFFRTASVNKFKIMFNKRYELNVYTEDDDMEDKIEKRCNVKEVLLEGDQQNDLELDRISTKLVKYTPHLYSFLYNHKNKSEIALEIFLKAFLSKDVTHKSSNSYRLVHLIQSVATTFLEIFQPEVQVLLSKIFWTQGKEHHYIRKWRPNYYNDVNIKNELINILFSDSPKTYLDSMRSLSKIGQKFREVFANPQISINEVMRNDSSLKDLLLDIVFQESLDKDQMNFLNPNYIIKKMFANYYLRDLNVNTEILNNIHKLIILHADQQDYITIGKFFRYVFFKDSGFLHANIFLESDLVIGMRVVYVLASDHMNEKRDIYWTVRSLITKKDVELPKALEYPENIITNTLRKCYQNPEMSRYIFMQTLENLFIYNNPRIGSFLDSNQGAFIYNLYRDLILNDIQKENSVLKTVLMESSYRIQGMLGLMIQSVVANVDNIKKLRQIATIFVNDTLSFAKIESGGIIQSEEEYVKLFKKLIARSSNDTDEQKKINFKIILLKHKFDNQEFQSDTIEKALSHVNLQLNEKMKNLLNEVYKKYGNNTDTLVRKIDDILDNRYRAEKEFEDIVAQDLKEGVTFDDRPITNETTSLFLIREGEEDPSMMRERIRKLKELNSLEDWYTEQAKYHQNLIRTSPRLNALRAKSDKINYNNKYEKKHKFKISETGRNNASTNVEKVKSQLKLSVRNISDKIRVEDMGLTRSGDSSSRRKGKKRVVIKRKKYINHKIKLYSKNLNTESTANIKFDRANNHADKKKINIKKYTVESEGSDKNEKPKSEKRTKKPNNRTKSKMFVEKFTENKNRSEAETSKLNLANRDDEDHRVEKSRINSNRGATKAEDKGTLSKETNSVVRFVEGLNGKNKIHSSNMSGDAKVSEEILKKTFPDRNERKLTKIVEKTSFQNNTKFFKGDNGVFLIKSPLKPINKDVRVKNEKGKSGKDVNTSLANVNETVIKTYNLTSNKTRDKSPGYKLELQIKKSGKTNGTFVANTTRIEITEKNPEMKRGNASKIYKKTIRIKSRVKILKGEDGKIYKPSTDQLIDLLLSNISLSKIDNNKNLTFMTGVRNRSKISEFNTVKKTRVNENVIASKNKTASSHKNSVISKSDRSKIPSKNLGKTNSQGGYNRKLYEKIKEALTKKLPIILGTLSTKNKTDIENNRTLFQKNKVKIAENETFLKTDEPKIQNVTTPTKKATEVKIPKMMKMSEKGIGNDTTKLQENNQKTGELSVVNRNRSLGDEKASEGKENRKNESISRIVEKNHNTEASRPTYPTNERKGPVHIRDKVSGKNTKLPVKKQEELNKFRDTKTEKEKKYMKINGAGKGTETNLVSAKMKMPKTSNRQKEIEVEKKKSNVDAQVDTLVKRTKIKPNSSKNAVNKDNKADSQLKPSLDKGDVTLEEMKNENGNVGPSSEVISR